MELRAATAADVPAIDDLVERAYAHYVPRIGGRPMPMDADHAAEVARGEVVVADDGGRIAGVIVRTVQPGHVYVDNLAVDPERQGAGVGRALLAHAGELAREHGLDQVRLFTHEKMTENRAIYARLGFVEAAREVTPSGHARVHLVKSL